MIPVNKHLPADGLPHMADLLAGAFGSLRDTLMAGSVPGLRPSHYRVMSLIPPDGLRLTVLAERAGITKAGIGQFTRYLEREGYVHLSGDPADNRAKIVTLTAAGAAAVEHSLKIIADAEQHWARLLGEERYRELRRDLFEIASPPEAPPGSPPGSPREPTPTS